MARDAGDVEEIVEPDQPLDRVDLHRLGVEEPDQSLHQVIVELAGDLEADHLAEAAAADLVLDRLAEVVGLVGDVVVGVAGDAEERVADDLHPREQRLEVVGDHLLERHERCAVADRQEAAEELLRHLDAREHLGVLLGVAQHDDQAEREVRDVGERPADAEDERGQRREHLPEEEVVDLAPLLGVRLGVGDDPDALVLEGGLQLPREGALDAIALLDRGLADRLDLLERLHAIGPGGQRGGDLIVEVGDPDHEELVQVRLPDGAVLEALDQGDRFVLGELEDAVVERHPRDLAVDQEIAGSSRSGAAAGGAAPLPVGSTSSISPWVLASIISSPVTVEGVACRRAHAGPSAQAGLHRR